jgi:FADH2 O2-dependent halogenase
MFRNLLEATAETCEKYEVGELDGDAAADIIFKLIDECELVNPVFGWKDPEHRFVWPKAPTMARFMVWASLQAPPELRKHGRAMTAGLLKAALHGKKLH